MKQEIDFLVTSEGKTFEASNPDGFNGECTIKHIGRQIYLVGYFDPYKAKQINALSNKVNKYILLFPSGIKHISFK